MVSNRILDKYADLVLDFGINLKPGQKIRINGEAIHKDFAALLAKKAYERGAQYVHTDMSIPMVGINRSHHQKDEYLNYVPGFVKAQVDQYINERWSLISLGGMEDPDINKRMNQDRNSIITKASMEVSKPLSHAAITGICPWTIVAVPTQKWAEKVTGKKGKRALELIWKDFISILRLNKKAPIESWRKHSELLKERGEKLNRMVLKSLHFTGPGTDLVIGLSAKARWHGGAMKSEGNGDFFPNIPSEEIFTSPDFRLTEGRVSVTRPVNVLGDQVVDAWFEFKAGEVVNFGAKYGKHLIENYFKIDPKAKRLGEVALVDGSSPIFKSKRIFHNILFDENAACHIALGRGFPIALEHGATLSEIELENEGCNQSLLHTDFMIGSEKISVDGHTAEGLVRPIIRKGKFVI
ncbi:MAG: hypothetical protein A2360_01385 [Candidatus Staskawiczbacteria bacterium RIFOXYB1_FULL_32_11]|nr:MAG: hypothetical protein A2360_01385 [Candidatus Staskawiczbacteria bacterium RIFOXYB1_FULL_32_11]